MKHVYGCLVAICALAPGFITGQGQTQPEDMSVVISALTTGTTFQQEQLIGKRFRGVISVSNVQSVRSKERTYAQIITDNGNVAGESTHATMGFLTSDLDKAARMKIRDKVLLTGTLDAFTFQPSGYSNVAGTRWALFKDVTIEQINGK